MYIFKMVNKIGCAISKNDSVMQSEMEPRKHDSV